MLARGVGRKTAKTLIDSGLISMRRRNLKFPLILVVYVENMRNVKCSRRVGRKTAKALIDGGLISMRRRNLKLRKKLPPILVVYVENMRDVKH